MYFRKTLLIKQQTEIERDCVVLKFDLKIQIECYNDTNAHVIKNIEFILFLSKEKKAINITDALNKSTQLNLIQIKINIYLYLR